MKSRRIFTLPACIALLTSALALPAVQAHEHMHGHGHDHEFNQQDRTAWIKHRLDREAAMLEIKASQESAWEAYAAAAQDLAKAYSEPKLAPAEVDAATIMRLHAEQAAAFAQRIGKLADAAAGLQAVLSDDQRKVFDRIVRMHTEMHARHHEHHWQSGEGGMAQSSKQPSPAKPRKSP